MIRALLIADLIRAIVHGEIVRERPVAQPRQHSGERCGEGVGAGQSIHKGPMQHD